MGRDAVFTVDGTVTLDSWRKSWVTKWHARRHTITAVVFLPSCHVDRSVLSEWAELMMTELPLLTELSLYCKGSDRAEAGQALTNVLGKLDLRHLTVFGCGSLFPSESTAQLVAARSLTSLSVELSLEDSTAYFPCLPSEERHDRWRCRPSNPVLGLLTALPIEKLHLVPASDAFLLARCVENCIHNTSLRRVEGFSLRDGARIDNKRLQRKIVRENDAQLASWRQESRWGLHVLDGLEFLSSFERQAILVLSPTPRLANLVRRQGKMVVIDQETHVKLPDDRLTTSLAAQVPPGTLGGLSMLTSTNLRRSTDGGPALCECGLSPGMCPFFRTNWRWVAPQNPGEVLCADEVAAFVCEPDAGCPGRLMMFEGVHGPELVVWHTEDERSVSVHSLRSQTITRLPPDTTLQAVLVVRPPRLAAAEGMFYQAQMSLGASGRWGGEPCYLHCSDPTSQIGRLEGLGNGWSLHPVDSPESMDCPTPPADLAGPQAHVQLRTLSKLSQKVDYVPTMLSEACFVEMTAQALVALVHTNVSALRLGILAPRMMSLDADPVVLAQELWRRAVALDRLATKGLSRLLNDATLVHLPVQRTRSQKEAKVYTPSEVMLPIHHWRSSKLTGKERAAAVTADDRALMSAVVDMDIPEEDNVGALLPPVHRSKRPRFMEPVSSWRPAVCSAESRLGRSALCRAATATGCGVLERVQAGEPLSVTEFVEHGTLQHFALCLASMARQEQVSSTFQRTFSNMGLQEKSAAAYRFAARASEMRDTGVQYDGQIIQNYTDFFLGVLLKAAPSSAPSSVPSSVPSSLPSSVPSSVPSSAPVNLNEAFEIFLLRPASETDDLHNRLMEMLNA